MVRFLALSVLTLTATACLQSAQASVPPELPPAVEERGLELRVPERSPLRSRLTVAEVTPRSVRHALNVPATTEADTARLARISPPLAGRLVRLNVRLGDSVKQGTPLFSLDSADLVAAESDYLKARTGEAQAERSLARQRDLREHGIGAQKDEEQARTELELARSERARAVARLELLGMAPGEVGKPLVVRSPLPGRVVELATSPGQYLNDPAAVLMTVADLSTVWITASVPEKDLARVAVGQDAQIEFAAYPGERLTGKVQLVGDMLAADTRTVKVRIPLENRDGRLKPGMFARVILLGAEAPEVRVPSAALRVKGDRSFLFVEKAPWVFERRDVEVGEAAGSEIAVARGLATGERIVTSNSVLLP